MIVLSIDSIEKANIAVNAILLIYYCVLSIILLIKIRVMQKKNPNKIERRIEIKFDYSHLICKSDSCFFFRFSCFLFKKIEIGAFLKCTVVYIPTFINFIYNLHFFWMLNKQYIERCEIKVNIYYTNFVHFK